MFTSIYTMIPKSIFAGLAALLLLALIGTGAVAIFSKIEISSLKSKVSILESDKIKLESTIKLKDAEIAGLNGQLDQCSLNIKNIKENDKRLKEIREKTNSIQAGIDSLKSSSLGKSDQPSQLGSTMSDSTTIINKEDSKNEGQIKKDSITEGSAIDTANRIIDRFNKLQDTP